MQAYKLVTFLAAILLALPHAFAQGTKSGGSDASSAGATKEKSRTAGGVSEDLLKEFRGLDTDKDGSVSQSELSSKPDLAAAFDKGDKNRDRKLDPAEYQVLKAEVTKSGE